MKKLFTLLILLCTVIGAKAALTVEYDQQTGFVVITAQSTGDIASMTSDQQAIARSSTSIKIVGPIGSNDFNKLKDFGLSPKILDLSAAKPEQSTLACLYKSDDGDYYPLNNQVSEYYVNLQNPVSYNSSNYPFPPIITVNNKEYKLFYAETRNDSFRLPDSGWTDTLEELYLPTDNSFKIVSSKFCFNYKKLSKVIVPDNVKVIGNEAFSSCSSLESINLNKVEYFCYQAFYHPAIAELTIPGTAVYIGKNAFADDNGVKKLVFSKPPLNDPYPDPDHYMIIKQEAFNNQKSITDIYINTTSEYVCENWGFSYEMTWAHGDPQSSVCTLHFPTEVAEHYSNLKHPLTIDIAKDAAKYHQWLLAHYGYAQATADRAGNGWWEFVNTGTTEEDEPPVIGGKLLRTYSDYSYDRLVPKGIKAYIVTGLKENNDGNYEVDLLQMFVIPKRTGVILYGEANSKNEQDQPILSLSPCEIANGFPLRRDYWYKLSAEDAPFMKNYLWPTCVALDPNKYVYKPRNWYNLNEDGTLVNNEYQVIQELVLDETENKSSVKPYDTQTAYTKTIAEDGVDGASLNGFFRNFYLARFGTTNTASKYKKEHDNRLPSNYVGFFRAKESTINSGYAYLRVRSSDMKDDENAASCGEIIVNGDNGNYLDNNGRPKNYNGHPLKNYQVEYNAQGTEVQDPTTSKYWYLTGEGPEGKPDMTWEIDDNWGNRSKYDESDGAFITLRFSGEPQIYDNGDGSATMILQVEKEVTNNDPNYYTLQGVKVAKPTAAGVYIYKGKKIIVK